ncbi:MAG: FtsX-like permease family protein [Clostridia bacterium]|nr:FtsX-like permease family protein [Clostridia bacterium]
MKNPLYKRLGRELWHDLPRYIVIFLFMALPIALCAGYMIGNDSMIRTYNEAIEKYNLEDGHFQTLFSLDEEGTEQIEKEENLDVFPLFYKEETGKDGHTVRVYDLSDREEINQVCLHKGDLPASSDEIALDRLYCENNEIEVGDSFRVGSRTLRVSGTISVFDYSCLFKRNTDTMFNAQSFTVALMSKEGYAALSTENEVFNYAFRFPERLTEEKAHERNLEIRKNLYASLIAKGNMLSDYLAVEDNQAVQFSIIDIEGDLTMMLIFGILIVGGLAFVFALSIKSQIENEAGSIGTLKALGYKNGELLAHYLLLPTATTLLAGVVGNILAYTVLKEYLVGLYYHSYSLPTYTTFYNAKALIFTTVIPILLVLGINLFILLRSLRIPALEFLRGNLRVRRGRKVKKLGTGMPFMTRFRLRVIGQNKGTYVALFFGTFFACVILMFGLMMSPLLERYKQQVTDSLLAPYQTVLKADVPVEDRTAEKVYMTQLQYGLDDIMVLGVEKTGADSRYFGNLKLSDGKVTVNRPIKEKYGLKAGEAFEMKEKYEGGTYRFTVSDVFVNDGSLMVFMPLDDFRETFGEGEYLPMVFSQQKLSVDGALVYKTVTLADLTAASDQLTSSMGDVFRLFTLFSVILFALLIYLLAKIVIERNARQIAMMKILGYKVREINRAYNLPTGIMVMISLGINTVLCRYLIELLWRIIVPMRMRGWLDCYFAPYLFPLIAALGLLSYLAVYGIESRKIARIPLSRTLKEG